MPWEAWLTLVVVLGTVGLLVTERVSPPFAILAAVISLLTVGVVDADQAFSGFSNAAPITVAALYVLVTAVEKTGAMERLTAGVLGARERSDTAILGRVLGATAGASSFLNNTPIVAMVAPAVISWARRHGKSPSRYLMPISFAAILGGLVTLIGTSTNLVVSGLLEQSGADPMGLFEISKIGLPVAAIGLVMLVLIGPRLLPTRRAPSEEVGEESREFTVEMAIASGSSLSGRSVAEAGLRNLEGVYLVQLERRGHPRAPVSPEELLEEGDRLTFAGNVERVVDLQRIPGLVSAEQVHFPSAAEEQRRRLFEAVVAEDSPLAHSNLKDVGFRSRYGAAVLAVHRQGQRVPGKLGKLPLRPGDVLLILAGDDFKRRWRDQRDFLVVAPLDGGQPPSREKAPVVGLVTLALFALVTAGVVDILVGSLLAAAALVGLRVLTPFEARNSVDLNVVVVIAASFGLGEAIATSGLADQIAETFVGSFAGFGDVGLLLGVIVATVILTELITNNAAAVLMFPIAIATATQAGLDPRGFAIAIAIGASASFLTPIGYQTNTMVYGMGGYRFGDFIRVGFPLTILVIVVAVLVIPIGWPL